MASRPRVPILWGRSSLALWLPLVLALSLLTSCAKKGPPSGGPPDVEPPRVVETVPDSGAAGVGRDAPIQITFSEGMEPRSTAAAIALAPPTEIRQRRWSRHAVTLVLAEPLKADQTYTLFVGSGARDRHGNPLEGGSARVFTTAAVLSPGVIEGRIEARGLKPSGIYVWCYRQDPVREPDSTAKDFDALGIADRDGAFRVVGLPSPGRYRLWAFADRNANRSFEPDRDLLVPLEGVIELTEAAPIAREVALHVTDPKAPGRAKGTVLDSLGVTGGNLQVIAFGVTDTTLVRQVPANERFEFDLDLLPGDWRLRAYRDLDQNDRWQPESEPSSDTLRVSISPGLEVRDLVLVLRRLLPGR